MGKRSKSSNSTVEPKVKNKKIKFEDNLDLEDSQVNPVPIKTDENTNKKKHKRKLDNSAQNKEKFEEIEDSVVESSSIKNVNTRKKNKNQQAETETKSDVDNPTYKKSAEDSDETNKQKKKTKDTGLSQEDEVKDEDIDKFCDELTEEDNVQYENWVKLIETKLNGHNKKKPK